MKTNKILKYVYVFFTIYAIYVIDVTTLEIIDLFPAIVLMWILYFIFKYSHSEMKNIIVEERERKNILDSKMFVSILIILLIVALNYSMKFYTGNTIRTLISSVLQGNHNFYQYYQQHHRENEIFNFTLTKIPYILMLFYVKFIFLVSWIEFFLIRSKKTKLVLILVIVSAIAHLMFGLSRGTNFEIFEVLIMIVFIIFNKYSTFKITRINKQTVVIILLLIFAAALFYNRIEIRSGFLSFDKRYEYKINENSIFVLLLGEFAKTGLLFYDYFMFGFYYTSRFLTEVVFSNFTNLIAILFPKGYELMNISSIAETMLTIAPRNTRWFPNIVKFIDNLGFILTAIYISLLGYVNSKIRKNRLFSTLLGFLIFLQMFTFPIGNLLFISSATTLTLITTLGILFVEKLFKYEMIKN